MHQTKKSILVLILCFIISISLCTYISAAGGDSKNTIASDIDAVADSFIETVISKIGSNPSLFCDIETKEQLKELHVNCGFRKYVLFDDLFANGEKLDFSEQDKQTPTWTYILSPNDETVGIAIEFCKNSTGEYELTNIGGKCKPFLESYVRAQKTAKKSNLTVSDKLIVCDTTTQLFVLTSDSENLLIPSSSAVTQENLPSELTVHETEELYKANVKEFKELQKKSNEPLYGNSFRFDLIDKNIRNSTNKSDTAFKTIVFSSIFLIAAGVFVLFSVIRTRAQKNDETIR